jgi:hypothetical protein
VKHRAKPVLLCGLVLLLGKAPAFAFDSEPGNPILDRFNIDVGTFFYGTGTTISLNGTLGTVGTPIDVEHALGFRNANRFRLDAYWRITKHQRLRLMYFDANRHTGGTLDRTFTYGDDTFPVAATVSSQNNVRLTALSYEYDFIVRDNFSLGATLGIHNFNYSLSISATTTTPTAPYMPVAHYQKASADGPLPLIGMSAIWRLTPTFYFTALAQGLKVTVNPYSGALQNYGVTATWQPFKNFGVGGGYDYFLLTASADAHRFNGSLDWRYSGPRVFFSASF